MAYLTSDPHDWRYYFARDRYASWDTVNLRIELNLARVYGELMAPPRDLGMIEAIEDILHARGVRFRPVVRKLDPHDRFAVHDSAERQTARERVTARRLLDSLP